jgi:hypothetical protein
VLGYGLEDRGSRVRFPTGLGIFLLTTASRTTLGPTQPPIQWVAGALYLGVKRPGREADHSPPSSAEVKQCVELYIHSPKTPSWRGVPLKKKKIYIYIYIHIHGDDKIKDDEMDGTCGTHGDEKKYLQEFFLKT